MVTREDKSVYFVFLKDVQVDVLPPYIVLLADLCENAIKCLVNIFLRAFLLHIPVGVPKQFTKFLFSVAFCFFHPKEFYPVNLPQCEERAEEKEQEYCKLCYQ